MKMFIHIDELKPLCEKIGYTNVVVDDSNSLMAYELPQEVEDEKVNEDRHRVHVGSEEFKHL